MLRLFRVTDNRAAAITPRDAIFPGHLAPVLRCAEDGERELLEMHWGFGLRTPSGAMRRVTNVRDDKLLTSKFWLPSFKARRCLVPASSYCEPTGSKPATWHWMARTEEGAEQATNRPLFAFPGIWTNLKIPPRAGKPAEDQTVFAFMTTTPNTLIEALPHDRMPVLLDGEDQFHTWLTGTLEEAFALVQPYDPRRMRIVHQGSQRRDLLAA